MAILLPHCDTRSLSFVGRGVKAKTNISFFFYWTFFQLANSKCNCLIWHLYVNSVVFGSFLFYGRYMELLGSGKREVCHAYPDPVVLGDDRVV